MFTFLATSSSPRSFLALLSISPQAEHMVTTGSPASSASLRLTAAMARALVSSMGSTGKPQQPYSASTSSMPRASETFRADCS